MSFWTFFMFLVVILIKIALRVVEGRSSFADVHERTHLDVVNNRGSTVGSKIIRSYSLDIFQAILLEKK